MNMTIRFPSIILFISLLVMPSLVAQYTNQNSKNNLFSTAVVYPYLISSLQGFIVGSASTLIINNNQHALLIGSLLVGGISFWNYTTNNSPDSGMLTIPLTISSLFGAAIGLILKHNNGYNNFNL